MNIDSERFPEMIIASWCGSDSFTKSPTTRLDSLTASKLDASSNPVRASNTRILGKILGDVFDVKGRSCGS